jgi:hypothetical protein
MKRGLLFLLLPAAMIVFSCAGKAEPVQIEEPPPEEEFYQEPAKVAVPAEENDFDPSSITKEVFEDTLSEVQRFIDELNRIISNKNYNSWLNCLGDSYWQTINSPEFLQEISEMPTLKKQGIVLKSAEDYFSLVVVPSRANARVDDIEFVSHNRVKAFTIGRNGVRLRIYDLERIQETWKIVS